MHRSFIWSTKPGLSTCALLKRFSGVITFLRAIYSLDVITCLTIFSYLEPGYLDSLASVSPSIHTPNILTCFEGFSSFLWPCSIGAKGAKSVDYNILLTFFAYFLGYSPSLSTNIRGVKVIGIGNTLIKDAYTWGFCIKVANTDNTGTKNPDTEFVCIIGIYNSACTRSTCVSGPSTVKRLEMHQQCY